MIVEETLVSLGDQPIKKSPFSHVMVAMVNSYFTRNNVERISSDTAANIVYERVWRLPKEERVELLNHTVGVVRDRNAYRLTLMTVAIITAIVVIPVMGIEAIGAINGTVGRGFDFLIGFFNVVVKGLEVLVPRL